MSFLFINRAMLKLGSSLPWQDAMEAMTGQRDILAQPLLDYFKPLETWLIAENRRNGDFVGWENPVLRNVEETEEVMMAEEAADPNLLDIEGVKVDKKLAQQLLPILKDAVHTLNNLRLRP